jgi:hypothetical protein
MGGEDGSTYIDPTLEDKALNFDQMPSCWSDVSTPRLYQKKKAFLILEKKDASFRQQRFILWAVELALQLHETTNAVRRIVDILAFDELPKRSFQDLCDTKLYTVTSASQKALKHCKWVPMWVFCWYSIAILTANQPRQAIKSGTKEKFDLSCIICKKGCKGRKQEPLVSTWTGLFCEHTILYVIKWPALLTFTIFPQFWVL